MENIVGIIDYGMGDLKNIKNALDILNIKSTISNQENILKKCNKLILPGVGTFNDAMKNLKERGLDEFIIEEYKEKKQILGICLGMQLLFEKSYEGTRMDGLGIFKGSIIRLNDEGRRIPHIGWNSGNIYGKHSILRGIKNKSYFYYVHSYIASEYERRDLIIEADYKGASIPGLFKKENIVGAQFYPEKSGNIGLKFLKNFSEGE